MYAIRQYEFGAPERLLCASVPDPVPGAWQIPVEVHAAGGAPDRFGAPRRRRRGPVPPPRLPMTLGQEVAGVVTGLGVEVDGRWLGRAVVVPLGAAAELVTPYRPWPIPLACTRYPTAPGYRVPTR